MSNESKNLNKKRRINKKMVKNMEKALTNFGIKKDETEDESRIRKAKISKQLKDTKRRI